MYQKSFLFCTPVQKDTAYRRGGVLPALGLGWVWDIHGWIMGSEEAVEAIKGEKGISPWDNLWISNFFTTGRKKTPKQAYTHIHEHVIQHQVIHALGGVCWYGKAQELSLK